MHIEILQENLSKSLNSVSRVIPSHPLIPILGLVYLQAKDGELKVVGGNGEIFIEAVTGAKIISSGEICLPIRTLQELVSTLDEGKIELKVQENIGSISSGKFKGKINGQAPGDYPKNSFNQSVSSQKLKIEELKKALERLLFCAATDESRPALTGISFKKTARGVQLAATDAFRLSVVDLESDLNISSLIVPAKVLAELLRMCSEEKISQIEIFVNNNELVFIAGENKIYSRLISSTFPNYEKIIPSNNSIKLVLAISQFQKTVKTAAIFARGNSNIVKLNLQKGKVFLTASSAGVGEEEQEVDGKLEGELEDKFSIAFNCRYLLDFLNIVSESDEIVIEMDTPLSPAIFKLPTDPSFLHVIMPVRI